MTDRIEAKSEQLNYRSLSVIMTSLHNERGWLQPNSMPFYTGSSKPTHRTLYRHASDLDHASLVEVSDDARSELAELVTKAIEASEMKFAYDVSYCHSSISTSGTDAVVVIASLAKTDDELDRFDLANVRVEFTQVSKHQYALTHTRACL